MEQDSSDNTSSASALKPDSEPPSHSIHRRESLWRRLANRFWGYDFFVSYNWASGGPYAVSLAERLRDRGYDCFLDQSEFAAGDDWKSEAQKALQNTRRLVVVATRKAIAESEAVRHEIEVFTRRSERVIPIVFGERFSEEDQRQFPTLQQIPDSTIDMIEDIDRLDKGPSDKILEQLIQAYRVIRKRSLRAFVVAVSFAILIVAATVASIFWGLAEVARVEEQRQKHLAISAELINKADLLRETQGPKLEESLSSAREAYENSRLAGETSEDALRAFKQALELMPQRIGEPWLPFGKPTPIRLQAFGQKLVLLNESPSKDREVIALVAELVGETKRWRVVHKFTREKHGELVTDEFGRPVEAPENPRWLIMGKDGHVNIWDVSSGTIAARLPFKHAPKDSAGLELLAINSDASHALIRSGAELEIWRLSTSSFESEALPMAYQLGLYAISPSGEMVARARQNEFIVVSVRDGKQILQYPITGGGGHEESLQFVEGSRYSRDQAVFVSWSANQVMAMATAARKDAPSWRAGIWYLDSPDLMQGNESRSITQPYLMQVRANPFEVVFSSGDQELFLAILDPNNPVQWLDLESQISFMLGGAAGPGKIARFGKNVILIAHTDGTARLWDVNSREELLRFTVNDAEIDDIAFLLIQTDNRARNQAVVTLDSKGNIQGWSTEQDLSPLKNLIDGKRAKRN